MKRWSVITKRVNMWFSLGRSEGFPTQYPPNATPVLFDTLDVGIISVFVILMICFAVAAPSTDKKSPISSDSEDDSDASEVITVRKVTDVIESDHEEESNCSSIQLETDQETTDEANVTKARLKTPIEEDSTTASHSNDNEECSICLMPIKEQELGSPEFCDHVFCLPCILKWSKNVNSCPIDRRTFWVVCVKDKGKIINKIPVYNEMGPRRIFRVLIGNFGQDWEVAVVQAKTPYKAGISTEINATIGVHIGLRSVNVTLKSDPKPNPELKGEIINYNERFTWTWDQGNFGFGPLAGRLQQEFRAAQLRGVPTPILWIVDYFVIDGEGYRLGRFYRTSGWYCHILMWTAFATWLLAIILFRSVIVDGGYCLGVTGILQLAANFVWIVVKNPNPLFIPFDGADLKTSYGSSFWITFFNGLLCLICATIIIVMDQKYDDYLYTYFEVDPLTSFDEISYLTPEEESVLRHKEVKNDIPLIPMANTEDEEDDKVEYIPVYKKRGTVRYRQNNPLPPPVPREKKPMRLINQVV